MSKQLEREPIKRAEDDFLMRERFSSLGHGEREEREEREELDLSVKSPRVIETY